MLKIGIIGCGMYAGAHARRLKAMADTQIVSLCSLTMAEIENLVERRLSDVTPAPARFTDTAAMYRDAQPDAVVIVTPHALHATHAIEALEHGCHVLVEKPMATTVADAERLAAAATAAGRHVLIGYNPPYTAAMQRVRAAIEDGSLGGLQLISAYLSQNWKALTAGGWRHDPKVSGGGQLIDSGAHLLAGLCWAVNAPVESVCARIDTRGDDVDVNSVLLLTFANGVNAAVTVGGDSLPDGSHTSFIFDKGRIDLDAWRGEWGRAIDEAGSHDMPEADGSEADPDAHLIDVLQGRAEPLVTPQFGLQQVRLAEALYSSAAQHGRPTRLTT